MPFNWKNPFFSTSLARQILANTERLMADFTKLSADLDSLAGNVTSAVTQLGALSADIAALKAQIAAITPDPTVQASIDAMDAKVTGISSTLTAGETANPA